MTDGLIATVWDDEQVLCDGPPDDRAVALWARIARRLIGDQTQATVAVDCDDADTEMQLRVAGFKPAEAEEEPAEEEAVTLEKSGPLGALLDVIERLPADAPLGALATGEGKGVDLDLGVGLDIWGEGALGSLRAAVTDLGIALNEASPRD